MDLMDPILKISHTIMLPRNHITVGVGLTSLITNNNHKQLMKVDMPLRQYPNTVWLMKNNNLLGMELQLKDNSVATTTHMVVDHKRAIICRIIGGIPIMSKWYVLKLNGGKPKYRQNFCVFCSRGVCKYH